MTWSRRSVRILLTLAASVAAVRGASAQAGLLGEYFESPVPPPVGSAPAFARVDPFVWAGDAPDGTPLVPDDAYSERWTGAVLIPEAGSWTFTTLSNDGVRLWLEEALAIDAWSSHFNREDEATIEVEHPCWLPLRLEHYNAGGSATIQLSFAGPGQPRTLIPPQSLCAGDACLSTYIVDAGPDQLVTPPQTSFTLAGRFRGLRTLPEPFDDERFTISWAQFSGAPALVETPGEMTTLVTPMSPGILQFRLKVIDPSGFITSDDVTVYAIDGSQGGTLSGTLEKWHTVTLTFQHDGVLGEQGFPNPFLDFRLRVFFLHAATNAVRIVPGFFAADGDAAETGATSGDRWRVHFSPDLAGPWIYLVSFRAGPSVAIDPSPSAGAPVSFDGAVGTFDVAPVSPSAPGFMAKGRLEYVGGPYLRFAETGEHYIESGTNSPENLLAYYEFDATFDTGGTLNDLVTGGYGDGLHHFDAHLGDFVDRGVPTWRGTRGRRLYGAIDYLAAQEVNALYAITFNIDGGDGREVWPWAQPTDKLRFDVSKLDQWGRVVEHMMRAGVALHVQTQETENEFVLDGGNLGVERKLYYRELIARFAHSPALFWDLGEENENSVEQRIDFIDYIRGLDAYDHPITLHPYPGGLEQSFGALLGSHLELAVIQGYPEDASAETEQLVESSQQSGRPWVVTHVEQAPAEDGVVPDAVDFWHDSIRKQALWGNLMARGGGVEWYFGSENVHDDLDCEDFQSRENMFRLTKHALDFFQRYLPFAEMVSAPSLTITPGARVLARPGEVYAVYLPFGGPATLNLQASSDVFRVDWYSPSFGGALLTGTVAQVDGPGVVSLGSPPPNGDDWVALVRRVGNLAPEIRSVRVEPDPFTGPVISIQVHATDPDGPSDDLDATIHVIDPLGQHLGAFPAQHSGGTLHTLHVGGVPDLASGSWTLLAVVRDAANWVDTSEFEFEAEEPGRSPRPRQELESRAATSSRPQAPSGRARGSSGRSRPGSSAGGRGRDSGPASRRSPCSPPRPAGSACRGSGSGGRRSSLRTSSRSPRRPRSP